MSNFQKYLDKYFSREEETSNGESEDFLKNIGVLIKNYRKEQGISQIQLAKISGINQGNISKIEKGKLNISLLVLRKIVESLGGSLNITIY